MPDSSSFASGATRFRVCDGAGSKVSRWETIEPFASASTWEGRVQFTDEVVTQVDLCGHLHKSHAEAEHCARSLAARLNAGLMPSGYLGDPSGRSRRRPRSRRGAFLGLAG